MITMTLLDGTTVRLPAPKGSATDEEGGAKEEEAGLTASDLVAALLARSQGADVSDILKDERWEPLVATLLRILLRKGLVADWEFVEEWNKLRG
jgi:type IV pilus assembly protein PilB